MDAARRVLLTDLLSVLGLSQVGVASWLLAEGGYPAWTPVGVVLAVVGTIGLLYAIEHDPVATVVDRTPDWQIVAAILAGVIGLIAAAALGLGLEAVGIMATTAGMAGGVVAYRLRYGILGPIPSARLAREADDADA